MKKTALILILLAAGYVAMDRAGLLSTLRPDRASNRPSDAAGDASADSVLASAFEAHRSDFQVQGSGTVTRVLADDNDGSRHQRFIVTLRTGQTVLIAHNVDVAPRVTGLKAGDSVEFNGEYEWNDKGGVIHWTHHDPEGRHTNGWLKHKGTTYE
jgi:hypothetical protein